MWFNIYIFFFNENIFKMRQTPVIYYNSRGDSEIIRKQIGSRRKENGYKFVGGIPIVVKALEE